MSNGDNWAGRSKGMVCNTCVFYVEKLAQKPEAMGCVRSLGRCRRRCPTMNGFPVVYVTDWCGDHKVDENKI